MDKQGVSSGAWFRITLIIGLAGGLVCAAALAFTSVDPFIIVACVAVLNFLILRAVMSKASAGSGSTKMASFGERLAGFFRGRRSRDKVRTAAHGSEIPVTAPSRDTEKAGGAVPQPASLFSSLLRKAQADTPPLETEIQKGETVLSPTGIGAKPATGVTAQPAKSTPTGARVPAVAEAPGNARAQLSSGDFPTYTKGDVESAIASTRRAIALAISDIKKTAALKEHLHYLVCYRLAYEVSSGREHDLEGVKRVALNQYMRQKGLLGGEHS